METARFDPDGGPLEAEVACAPPRDGSYTLTLWEGDSNDRVTRWKGNFLNLGDDVYTLPGTLAEHEGRLVEALVVVAVPPGVGPSTVRLTVRQDGVRLVHGSVDIPPGTPGGLADLFIRLEPAS